jgi:hypothetical protein
MHPHKTEFSVLLFYVRGKDMVSFSSSENLPLEAAECGPYCILPASLLWRLGPLPGLIVEHRRWCKVDPVAVVVGQALDTRALVDDPVQTIGVLDQPCAILPTHPGMQARDALRGNLYIVTGKAANSEHRLIEQAFTNNLAVQLDPHTSARW